MIVFGKNIKKIVHNKYIHNASYIYLNKEFNEVKLKNSSLSREINRLTYKNNDLMNEISLLKKEIDKLLIEKSMTESRVINLQNQIYLDLYK